MKRFLLAVAAASALTLSASRASAQIHELTPEDPNRERRAYNAAVQVEFNKMMNDWRAAWNSDAAGALIRFYTPDAALLLAAADAPVRGRQQITEALTAAVRSSGDINTGVDDFRVAGDLAYGLGRYHITSPDGSEALSGTYMIVLENRARRWLIRSQLFRPDQVHTAAAGGEAPAADGQ
jgi:uncharacterized protein (TIGR02246 family)